MTTRELTTNGLTITEPTVEEPGSAETPRPLLDGARDHVDSCLDQCVGLPDLDLEVEGIVERIQGLEKRFKRTMEETLEEWDLSYGEWKVLGALRRSEHAYGSTPGELSAQLELSSGAMTNRLDGLERAGLVRRLPDPADRRGVRVELTDAGNRAWLESTNAQAIKEALVAGALSKSEQILLNGLLRKLMLEFDRDDGPLAAAARRRSAT